MNGEINITLQTDTLRFELCFSRNVSFIRGDSGTGKTYLCDLIEQSRLSDSGVTLEINQDVPIVVMPVDTLNAPLLRSWVDIFTTATDTLFVIDEDCDCLRGKPMNLSKVIKHTSNYYVIISRDRFSDIPYSVHSIYELKVQPNPEYTKILIKNQQVFSNSAERLSPELIITEDSGTGYDFFKRSTTVAVQSAKTKTKVSRVLKGVLQQSKQNILVVVDGAAFGSEIEEILQIIKIAKTKVLVFLPESFEWYLLHSLLFAKNHNVQLVLSNFLSMIDYTKYFSTEQYFTDVLENTCKEYELEYCKSSQSLPEVFLSQDNITHLLSLIPDVRLPIRSISQAFTNRTNLF